MREAVRHDIVEESMACDIMEASKTVWPSVLRCWHQAPVRKGVGSEPHSCHDVVSMNTITSACRDPGLNRGPSDLQSDALPTELSRLERYGNNHFYQLQRAEKKLEA